MVKANELRIGNYINYSGNHRDYDGTFNEEFARYLFDVKDEWDMISGIPLTKDWLMKFGFKQITYQTGEKTLCFQADTWNVTNYANEGFKFWISECDDCPYYKEIKHVHQLQNLYFALTDNELEIK